MTRTTRALAVAILALSLGAGLLSPASHAGIFLNTHPIGESLPPARFADPSFTEHAVTVLGPARP